MSISILPAKHYLSIWQTRLSMAERGVTHPPKEVVEATRRLIAGLSALPPDAGIEIKIEAEGALFKTTAGDFVGKIPLKHNDDPN